MKEGASDVDISAAIQKIKEEYADYGDFCIYLFIYFNFFIN